MLEMQVLQLDGSNNTSLVFNPTDGHPYVAFTDYAQNRESHCNEI